MTERADPFGDFDVSGFTPVKPTATTPREDVRKVAEGAAFKSREPERTPEEGRGAHRRRERRIHRTGRNVQFFCKAEGTVVDAFYAISNEQDWVMGETLARAVSALKREIGRAKTSQQPPQHKT